MSTENSSVKIMNLYAKWYHAEKTDATFGDRKDEPTLEEFIKQYVLENDNISDLLNSSKELKALAEALNI